MRKYLLSPTLILAALLLPAAQQGSAQPRGGGSMSGSNDDSRAKRYADAAMRRYDKNGDGVLTNEELASTSMGSDKSKFDANKDGLIDVRELAKYVEGRIERVRQEQGDRSSRNVAASARGENRSSPSDGSSTGRSLRDAKDDVLPDPGSMNKYKNELGKSFYFRVTGKNSGSLWGTKQYTTDSRLAKAAIHAGAVQDGETAVVKATIVSPPASFSGSTRNGVKSNNWGSYPAAYTVARSTRNSDRKYEEGVKDAYTELDVKPKVYVGAELPEGMPSWFAEVDTNDDGQIALFEWRAAKCATDTFVAFDQNDDTFIVPDEVKTVTEMAKNDRRLADKIRNVRPSSAPASRNDNSGTRSNRFGGGDTGNRSRFGGGGFPSRDSSRRSRFGGGSGRSPFGGSSGGGSRR